MTDVPLTRVTASSPTVDLLRRASAPEDRYRALLGVSEAIATQRDLPALFHELAGQLVEVVAFDALSLVLHEAATDTMHLHVLETWEPVSPRLVLGLRPEDDPAGLVWQTQQPLITSNVADLKRWPRLLERVQTEAATGRFPAVVAAPKSLIDPIATRINHRWVELVIDGSPVERIEALTLAIAFSRQDNNGVAEDIAQESRGPPRTLLHELQERVRRLGIDAHDT